MRQSRWRPAPAKTNAGSGRCGVHEIASGIRAARHCACRAGERNRPRRCAAPLARGAPGREALPCTGGVQGMDLSRRAAAHTLPVGARVAPVLSAVHEARTRRVRHFGGVRRASPAGWDPAHHTCCTQPTWFPHVFKQRLSLGPAGTCVVVRRPSTKVRATAARTFSFGREGRRKVAGSARTPRAFEPAGLPARPAPPNVEV